MNYVPKQRQDVFLAGYVVSIIFLRIDPVL